MTTEIDALLDRMLQCSPEERRAFVEQFGKVARAAGVSAADAAAAMADLARRLGPEARGAPRECRDWTPRAWAVPGHPRAEDPCELAIETWAPPVDLDAAPQRADNWRERAVRAAAVSMCDPEPRAPSCSPS